MGQERALGALGFTRGEFSDSLRQQLVDRIDGQQPCFDSFQALGSPATVQLFTTECQAGLDIEQLRRIACTRQPAADGGKRRCAGSACKPSGLSNCAKWKSN